MASCAHHSGARPPATRRPYLDHVSLAAVALVLDEWLMTGEFNDNRGQDPGVLEAVEATFERLPPPDYPLWAEPDGAPVRWYSGGATVLRADGDQWLWVRAGSDEELRAAREALPPGDWIMSG
jgi:hypothetical protein